MNIYWQSLQAFRLVSVLYAQLFTMSSFNGVQSEKCVCPCSVKAIPVLFIYVKAKYLDDKAGLVQGKKVYWYKYAKGNSFQDCMFMTVLHAVLQHENPCLSKPRYTVCTITVRFKVACGKYWSKRNTNVLSILLLIWLTASKLENTGSGALYSIDQREILMDGLGRAQHNRYTNRVKMHIINNKDGYY